MGGNLHRKDSAEGIDPFTEASYTRFHRIV